MKDLPMKRQYNTKVHQGIKQQHQVSNKESSVRLSFNSSKTAWLKYLLKRGAEIILQFSNQNLMSQQTMLSHTKSALIIWKTHLRLTKGNLRLLQQNSLSLIFSMYQLHYTSKIQYLYRIQSHFNNKDARIQREALKLML